MAAKQSVIVDGKDVYILTPGMKIYVKTADVCKMLGASNQWVGQLTSQGSIHKSKTPHGNLYELVSTGKEYGEFMDAKRTKLDAEDEKLEKVKRKADATLKASKAKIAQAEAKELSGQMHRSEDVATMTAELIYTIRGALMALPSRVAINAAALSDPAEVAEYMRGEVNQIAEEIAGFRYDPAKYEARIRERRSWTEKLGGDEDE